MGTFGNTSSIGASSGRNDGLLSKFTVPEACTLDSITIYLSDARSATSLNVAIYDHDSGGDLPLNLLAQGTAKTISVADNLTWITFTGFSVSLTAGQIVWLGGRGNAKTGMLWTTGTKLVDTLGSGTTVWTDPYDVGGSSWALDLAIYATYTPAGAVDLSISVNEAVSTIETLAIAIAVLSTAVSDSTLIVENINPVIDGVQINISTNDNIIASEYIKISENMFINVSDGIVVIGNNIQNISLNPSAFDGIILTENISRANKNLYGSTWDSVILSEMASIFINQDINVSVFDSALISENASSIGGGISFSAIDSVITGEDISQNIQIEINQSDLISISENLNQTISELIGFASENIIVSETTTAIINIAGALSLNVSDSIIVGEFNTSRISINFNIFDSLATSENVFNMIDFNISTFDNGILSESIIINIPAIPGITFNVSDSALIAENIMAAIPNLNSFVVDAILTAETNSIAIEAPGISDESFSVYFNAPINYIEEKETIIKNINIFETNLVYIDTRLERLI